MATWIGTHFSDSSLQKGYRVYSKQKKFNYSLSHSKPVCKAYDELQKFEWTCTAFPIGVPGKLDIWKQNSPLATTYFTNNFSCLYPLCVNCEQQKVS